MWSAPCGQGEDHTPDLAVSLDSEGPRPSVFDCGPRKHNWQGGSEKCEVDTCLCQTLWVLQHAKLVWKKVGQTMRSKIQQSGHFLLSRNYTNTMCRQDLHIFANGIAYRGVIVIASAASPQSLGTFMILQATKNLITHSQNCKCQP